MTDILKKPPRELTPQEIREDKLNKEIETLKAKLHEVYGTSSKFQSRCNKLELELIETRAKVYEVLFLDSPAPADKDLKSQVVYFRNELSKVILQRDGLRKKVEIFEKKDAKIPNTPI